MVYASLGVMRWDVGKLLDRLGRVGERLGLDRPRPPGEKFYLYILLFFIGYLVADSTALYLRTFMLPSGTVGKSSVVARRPPLTKFSSSQFSEIKKRNIFNSDHLIAKTAMQKKDPEGKKNADPDNTPIKSNLPLQLIGTIVHGRKGRSVVTLQIKGKATGVKSFKVDEEVEGLAKIIEITRNKVIFRNLDSRKLEYLEIIEDEKIKIGVSGGPKKKAPVVQAPSVEKTQFSLSRAEVDKQLSNLSAILQDAKAVPYTPPGSSELQGFKLVAIKSGSIYETLGLKRGDVLQGVNGEDLTSPQQGMELYQELKDASNIKLKVLRGGKPLDLNYDIK